VIRYINLWENEVIVLDTQAGVEHLCRFSVGIARYGSHVNAVQVVKKSVQLARDLEIKHVHLMVNRVRSEKDIEKVHSILGETKDLFSWMFYLLYEPQMLECEPDVRGIIGTGSGFAEGVQEIRKELERYGRE
jgi:CO dehydrogenase maturation factor